MLPAGVHIAIIEHAEQRMPTVGDWWLDKDNVLQIRTSRTGTPVYAYLVAVHECVEALTCLFMGVTPAQVDDFDLTWEMETRQGKHSVDAEPGDDRGAVYHRQHVMATLVERTVALFLGVNWDDYEAEITALWNTTRET